MDKFNSKLFEEGRGRGEKALYLLSQVGSPSPIAKIRDYGLSAGLREISKWNLSDVLKKQVPYCILRPEGWVLTSEGELQLASLGYLERSPLVSKTGGDLERHVNHIKDSAKKAFAAEAVACFNGGQHRACVVLSWVGAIWILENYIVENCLEAFNKAGASRLGKEFKKIISIEHFTRMQESMVLQLSEDIGLIDKNMKGVLIERLNFRNTCGHPNMVIIDDHSVANHVSLLLNNVYERF